MRMGEQGQASGHSISCSVSPDPVNPDRFCDRNEMCLQTKHTVIVRPWCLATEWNGRAVRLEIAAADCPVNWEDENGDGVRKAGLFMVPEGDMPFYSVEARMRCFLGVKECPEK